MDFFGPLVGQDVPALKPCGFFVANEKRPAQGRLLAITCLKLTFWVRVRRF